MTGNKSNRDFTLSRSIVESALTVYVQNDMSVKSPVQCLDLSIENKESEKWLTTHGSSVVLMETKINVNGCNNNDSHTTQSCESNYSVIEKTDFNFIYVECTTEGSTYFDGVFRKIARNGMFALSTSDDPALYGRPAEPALRCYAGRIIRTFYASEMAVRLILAAMTRSAARFSKSIEVLLAMVQKNTITIIVKVKKGADAAVTCLKEVKTLLHCNVCEERVFLPENDGFVVDDVPGRLSCSCATENVGRTMMTLGPLWAGPLGSVGFISDMLPHAKHSPQQLSFLQDLILELRCDRKATKLFKESTNTKSETRELKSEDVPSEENALKSKSSEVKSEEELIKIIDGNILKRKADSEPCDVSYKKNKVVSDEPAPAFHYNLHKHKPKGAQHLLKVDKVIEILQKQGFRASRTHFDRAAVKTNASLVQLQSTLSQVT